MNPASMRPIDQRPRRRAVAIGVAAYGVLLLVLSCHVVWTGATDEPYAEPVLGDMLVQWGCAGQTVMAGDAPQKGGRRRGV